LVAFDLIGHGASLKMPKKSDYHFEKLKNDVMTIFDKYASKRPYSNVIISHSYGTCFAAVLSRERSDLVRKIRCFLIENSFFTGNDHQTFDHFRLAI